MTVLEATLETASVRLGVPHPIGVDGLDGKLMILLVVKALTTVDGHVGCNESGGTGRQIENERLLLFRFRVEVR